MPLSVPPYITIKTAASATAAYLSPETDGLKDAVMEREINGESTFTFSLPILPGSGVDVPVLTIKGVMPAIDIANPNDKWQYLNDQYRLYAPDITGQMREFIILNSDAVEASRDGEKVWGTVTAHESWVRLGKDYVDPAGISNDPNTPDPPPLAVVIVSGGSDLSGGLYEVGSAGHALYAILQGTGWSVGTVDVAGTHDLETEKISVLENINKIQEIWGGYLVWDSINKTVSLRDETTWATYTGYQIRYAKNLKEINRVDDYNVITKLYPFGENDLNIAAVNDGNIYLTNNTYTAEVLEGIWVNQDIADQQELKDEATKYLAKVCQPRHNYTIKQVDLRLLSGYQHEDFDLGHMVDIIDSELNIDIQARIIRYKYNVFQPWQCELEVGDPIEKIESKWENSQAMVKYLNSIKNTKGELFTPVYLVDESVTRQKIADAAIDATKLSTKIIILLNDTWTDNSPAAGSVAWNQHNLYYNGTEHVITAGNTAQKYIYWDGVSNTYSTSAAEPTLADGQFIIAVNNGGLHDTVWDKGYAREFIGSAFIADAAIKTAHIADAQIVDAHIASITANKITSGQIYSYLVETIGKGGYFRLTSDGLKAYSATGELKAHFGWYESLAAQLATFTRASTAYLSDGSSVASGAVRYEYTRLPAPVWQDLFDTDQLATQYASGGDVAGTWAVSGGVLTGIGGTQATLIKNDLLLQDCEIVVNSDQAEAGGIFARYQDNNNYYLLLLSDDSGELPNENLMLFKRVGGTFTTIATVDLTWTRGTSKQIKFSCKGSRLEAYFDGVKVISVIDTTFTGGSVGLWNHSATAFRVLDFTVYYVHRGAMIEEGTTNLLTANQASVETDLTGLAAWSANASHTLSRDTTTAWHGSASAKLVSNYAGSQNMCIIADPRVSVTAGLPYLFLVHAKSNALVGRKWVINVEWYDAGGVYLSTSYGTQKDISSLFTEVYEVFTAPASAATADPLLFLVNALQNEAIWWDGAMVAQVGYRISWQLPGTARSAEVLTAPTAGVFQKGNWTVKLRYRPTSVMNAGSVNKVLWNIHIDANNWYLLGVGWNGELYGRVNSGGTSYNIASANGFITPGNTYFITLAGNGSTLLLCCNGAQVNSGSYVESVGTLPANMKVGSWDTNEGNSVQANGIISDFAVMNIAQTLAEHQAAYATGLPLTVDEYTTLLMSMDGTLQPTVRGFGLWSKNGRYILQDPAAGQGIEVWDGATLKALIGRLLDGTIGVEIRGGAVYSSLIRSAAVGATANYIEIAPAGNLNVVGPGGKRTMRIIAGADQGTIFWYDWADGTTELARALINGASTKEFWLRGTNGLDLDTAHGEHITLGPHGGVTFNGINYNAGTGYNNFYGDIYQASGTKRNVEKTVNYGKRLLSVRESPEQKYIDEAKAQLNSGICTVMLDPIFLECIEPDAEGTPWLIHLTTYADIGVYVAEIGKDYFVVKERNNGTSNSVFVWSLSATRKNYAYERFMEVI